MEEYPVELSEHNFGSIALDLCLEDNKLEFLPSCQMSGCHF
jgi:hypothetical protein